MKNKEEIEKEIAHHVAQMKYNYYAQGAVAHLKWVLEDSPKKIESLRLTGPDASPYNENGQVGMWDKINELIEAVNALQKV